MTLNLASGEMSFCFCGMVLLWFFSWHLMCCSSVITSEAVSFCLILIQQGRNSVFCFPVGGAIAQVYGFPYLLCLQLHLRIGPFYPLPLLSEEWLCILLIASCVSRGHWGLPAPSVTVCALFPGAQHPWAADSAATGEDTGKKESGLNRHLRGQGCFPPPPVAICSLDDRLSSHSQRARLLLPSSAFPLRSSPPSFKCTDAEFSTILVCWAEALLLNCKCFTGCRPKGSFLFHHVADVTLI